MVRTSVTFCGKNLCDFVSFHGQYRPDEIRPTLNGKNLPFYKWQELCDFLFAFLDDVDLLKWGLLFKKRICSFRSKFFSSRVDPNEKGGRKEKLVFFLDNDPILLQLMTHSTTRPHM